jgi:hypothetical protein
MNTLLKDNTTFKYNIKHVCKCDECKEELSVPGIKRIKYNSKGYIYSIKTLCTECA